MNALVLGAGRSQRMGTDKLLLPWTQEHCVIEHILYQIEASQCFESVFIVTRSEVTELHRKVSAASLPCCPKLLFNDDAHGDMLSSIRMGVKASLSASHLMVFLGDQPGISFKLIQQLCRVPEGNQQLVQPADASGRGGHPVLIPQCFFQKVLSSYEDEGLRGLFREYASSVLRIPVNDPILLADIDTPLDYQRCHERSLETHKKGEA